MTLVLWHTASDRGESKKKKISQIPAAAFQSTAPLLRTFHKGKEKYLSPLRERAPMNLHLSTEMQPFFS